MWLGMAAIALGRGGAFTLLVGPDLHLRISSSWWSRISHRCALRVGAVAGAVQFPQCSGMPLAIGC